MAASAAPARRCPGAGGVSTHGPSVTTSALVGSPPESQAGAHAGPVVILMGYDMFRGSRDEQLEMSTAERGLAALIEVAERAVEKIGSSVPPGAAAGAADHRPGREPQPQPAGLPDRCLRVGHQQALRPDGSRRIADPRPGGRRAAGRSRCSSPRSAALPAGCVTATLGLAEMLQGHDAGRARRPGPRARGGRGRRRLIFHMLNASSCSVTSLIEWKHLPQVKRWRPRPGGEAG